MTRRQRGRGSVRFHEPSKLWRAALPASLDPTQRPEYFATHEEATRWLDGELARIGRQAAGPSADMSLRDYLAGWLGTMSASADWSPGTVDSVLTHFRYLDPLGSRPLSSITRNDLQLVIADLVRDGGMARTLKDGSVKRRKLKASYIRLAVGYWRRALQTAVEDELIPRNPAARLMLPPTDGGQRASWNPAEVRKLAPAIAGHTYEAVMALVLGCGLRIGEALAVRWDMIDWQRQVVRIMRTDDKRHGILERTKQRSEDDVPLLLPVLAALRRQQQRQTWAAVYVSEWRAGKRASHDVIAKWLKRLAVEVGVRPLSAHAGRHAVGNVLGAANIPLATISKRLRHRSTKTTADWYLQSEDVGEAAASELLENLFSGGPMEDSG